MDPFKASIIGIIISLIVLILPTGNAIIGAIIVKGYVNINNISTKEEMLIMISTLVSIMLINTIKEIIDPKMSGNEDIIAISIATHRWSCLEITLLQQIKETVEAKISGLLIGIIVGFLAINLLHITTSSINLPWLIAPILLYVGLNKETSEIQIKTGLYLLLVAMTLKLLINLECVNAIVVCIYTFFYIPGIVCSLIDLKEKPIRLHKKTT
jgi:hypothetical protein